jgi:hypothetical protein
MTDTDAPLPLAQCPERAAHLLAELSQGRDDPLARLVEAFGLSPFEREIVLLCVGAELDSGVAAAIAAHGAPGGPSFALALAQLAGPHWSACAPEAPLRRWRLIVMAAGPLTQAVLSIDERVLQFLLGQGGFDERLAPMLDWLPGGAMTTLVPSHAAQAETIAARWSAANGTETTPTVILRGRADDALAVVAAAAAQIGAGAMIAGLRRLPAGDAELDSFIRLWSREAVLSGAGVLVIDGAGDATPPEDAGWTTLARLADRSPGPLVVLARDAVHCGRRATVELTVAPPTRAEQAALWRDALGKEADTAQVEAIASQFTFSAGAIRALSSDFAASADRSLWDLCRLRLRGGLDGLASRVEGTCGWHDLVLPEPQTGQLRAIAGQLRARATVYEHWGFGQGSARGQGVNVLFHGPSGAGKTLAAEVLANDLALDLYQVDLSRVVSKYIGETEANLRRIFDAAENSGAILLFDEADSLFGTRSEVKDSHDRYANLEVSYLLQKMEAYRGLAILTTNMRAALDPAFLRRLRHAVAFPFPDAEQRAEIWTRVFPREAQTEGLDPARLARLRLAGGNIRNVALNAAFLAAGAGEPIRRAHVRAAAEAEYAKLERRLTTAEAAAWG